MDMTKHIHAAATSVRKRRCRYAIRQGFALCWLLLIAACGRPEAPAGSAADLAAGSSAGPTVSGFLPYPFDNVPTQPDILFMFDEYMLAETVIDSVSIFQGVYEPPPGKSEPGEFEPEYPCWECTDPIPPPGEASAASVQPERLGALSGQSTTLELVSVCDGMWRVTNLTGTAVSFAWSIDPGDERGGGIVQAYDEVFFHTSQGDRIARLFVGDIEQAVRTQGDNACSTPAGEYVFSEHLSTTTVTFRPSAPLRSNTTYTAVMSTKPQRESDGRHLQALYARTFTTSSGTSEPRTFRVTLVGMEAKGVNTGTSAEVVGVPVEGAVVTLLD